MPKEEDAFRDSAGEAVVHTRVLLRETKMAIRASLLTVHWLLMLSDEEIGGLYRANIDHAVALMNPRSRAQIAGMASGDYHAHL